LEELAIIKTRLTEKRREKIVEKLSNHKLCSVHGFV
jgi:hypothetical protein